MSEPRLPQLLWHSSGRSLQPAGQQAQALGQRRRLQHLLQCISRDGPVKPDDVTVGFIHD